METRREPYSERCVKSLSTKDYKVALSGYVLERKENAFFLDDGTGQIMVHSVKMPEVDFVRVFGKLLIYENGYELEADIVQDYSKVDKELLKKVKDLFC